MLGENFTSKRRLVAIQNSRGQLELVIWLLILNSGLKARKSPEGESILIHLSA